MLKITKIEFNEEVDKDFVYDVFFSRSLNRNFTMGDYGSKIIINSNLNGKEIRLNLSDFYYLVMKEGSALIDSIPVTVITEQVPSKGSYIVLFKLLIENLDLLNSFKEGSKSWDFPEDSVSMILKSFVK